jgi:type 1 glutamine amidotransferase
MKNQSTALLLCALALAFCAPLCAGEPAAEQKLRVLLTFGGHDFEQKPFFAMWDALPGVQYTKAPMPASAKLFQPGLEKEYDVIVMYDMVAAFTPEQQKAFVELLKTGIGVVALHHNLGAHKDWDEYRKIIGGAYLFKNIEMDGKKYSPSGYAHDQDMKVTIADAEHPITKGLKDFQILDECYCKYYTSPTVKVLLKTDHPKNDPSLAWVQEYGKSRVFYLMLGHDHKAWQNPNYPELLVRGIKWVAGK